MQDGNKSRDTGTSSGAARGGGRAVGEQHDDSNNSSTTEGETGESKPKATTTRRDGRLYVEKNSLDESQLVVARDEARSQLQRLTDLGRATEDDVNKDKRAANRLSAFQSRKRRVNVLNDLEQKTTKLQNDNTEQASQISNQGEQIRRMTAENERLREEIECRKRRAISTSADNETSDATGTGGGQAQSADADTGAAAIYGCSYAESNSNDTRRESSVQSMLVHLQTLQRQQQVDRDTLSRQQSRDRNELATVQRHQQEQLNAVQSQEQEQLSTSQQQDKRLLTSTQNQQLRGMVHGFGCLPAAGAGADRSSEATMLALVGELASNNQATATATQDSSSNTADSPVRQQPSGAGDPKQPPSVGSHKNNEGGGAAGGGGL
jgi:hypothetical protein